MFTIFKTKPLLTDEDAQWIFDTFEWALQHFDAEEFFQRTQLIEPSDKFFPGKVDSHQAVASTVFSATLKYSGLSHWPMQLVHPDAFSSMPPVFLNLDFSQGIKRNSSNSPLPALLSEAPLQITYNLNQTLKPVDLSASFAHYIAQHLVAQTQVSPVDGRQFFAPATEVLAVFMGFGILMSNSAYTFRGGCGSCYNAAANRHAYLSEDKMVFALALFCRLKGLKTDTANQHLKKYLRSGFKRALKQIDEKSQQLTLLQSRFD